jgi:restriction system protein
MTGKRGDEYEIGAMNEVEEKTRNLASRIDSLSNLLQHTLSVDDTIVFDSLRIHQKFQPFALPPSLQTSPPAPDRAAFLSRVERPEGLSSHLPWTKSRYRRDLEKAEEEFRSASQSHASQIAALEAKIDSFRKEYEEKKQAFDLKVQQRDQEIDRFERNYREGDPQSIVQYCTMVLERSQYPEGFPREFRTAYIPESKELVIEYELPSLEVIPAVAEYRYVKTARRIVEKPHKASEVKRLYQNVVAAVCLRTIHEVLEADQQGHLDVVVFNGFVQAIDPATGQDIRPHLISVRTTKERFCQLNLARIEMRACLRHLGAQVSSRPDELLAVKPVVEFDMVDKRFVEQSDVLSDLEGRPNLMDLNPFEFENLVSNLFGRMGLETKQTRSTRDSGVDAIAYDTRPIIGGKVVIQAKRYKNAVGVSAVRDLYGTMMNEGANKGILVTTSSYGPDAYDFASDKPIELVNGSGLLYLLEQVGVKARIVFPEE